MRRLSLVLAGLTTLVLASGSNAPRERTGQDIIGRIDTVGGTTYDWQSTGPVASRVYWDSGYGIHAVWTYSTEMSGTTFPDRNTRYNFYDFALHDWNWLDPDFMQSGVNVFTQRTGQPSLGVSPVTHCAQIGAHVGDLSPVLARDASPGAGIFDYQSGEPTCSSMVYPRISISSTGRTHVALTDAQSLGKLYYSGVDSLWSVPFHIPSFLPDPGYPAYAIAASRRRPHVCIMWTAADSEPRRLYYRRSTDDGQTWLPPDSLPTLPAFHPGSETVPSIGTSDLYPWYDPEEEDDDFSGAVAVYPVVQGQGMVMPAEIWHWRTGSGWSRVARAECDTAHMSGGVGYNALYASRPTLGRCAATGQLVCVWEQFDSTNVEPRTGLLRADIWAARGDGSGANWGVPARLTDPDGTSKRFPSVAGWTASDTFVVTYEIDGCAGFAIYGQGPTTPNPIAVHYVSIESLPLPTGGAAEPGRSGTQIPEVCPTVVRGVLNLPKSTSSSPSRLLDIGGRKVMELHHGANDVRSLAPGIYFVRAVSREPSAVSCRKVVIAR